jgi:hypothetical protein
MKMNNTTSGSETVENIEATEQSETIEETEAVEASDETNEEVEEVEEEVELLTIEELMEMTNEDYDEFTEDANHKGMKPLHEWMQHIPEDVRKHVANIRSSYTRKTQEIAEMRKELQKEKEALHAQRQLAVNNPYLKQAQQELEKQGETQNDLYTEQGLQAEIKRQAALMMQEMMKPAQEQMQVEHRRMQLQQFKAENPELMDNEYRMPVAQMLQERPELKLEDAFYIVKAKVESAKAKAERAAMEQQRSSRRKTLRKTSSGKSVTPSGTPKFKNAWDAYQYHKSRAAKK